MTLPDKGRLILLLFAFCFFLQVTTTWCAGPEAQPVNFEKAQAKIKEISRGIKNGPISPAKLETAKQLLEQFTRDAATCIDTTTTQISRLEQETASLGPVAEHEAATIIKERKNLARQKQTFQVALSECRLLATLTTRLENELADQDKLLQAANFFSKTDTFWGRFIATLPTFAASLSQSREYAATRSGFQDLTLPMFVVFFVLIAAGGFAGVKLIHLLQRWNALYHARRSATTTRPVRGIVTAPIALAALMGGSYLLYLNQESLAAAYGPWLVFSCGLYGLSLLLFHLRSHLALTDPATPPGTSVDHHLRFNLLAFFAVLLFFSTRLDLNDFDALAPLLDLGQAVIICGICVVGWWFLWPVKLPQKLLHFERFRCSTLTIVALLGIGTELSGYRNLSIFILLGILGSVVLAFLLRLSLYGIDVLIGGFFTGRHPWQMGLRHKLGLSSQDRLTGIAWIGFIFKLLAWSIAGLLFLRLWGLPDTQEKVLRGYLVDGFHLGEMNIAPVRLIFGLFIFACGWSLFAWVKMRMETKWLDNADLSFSARETLVTMTGYCGFAFAILFGLSSAGFSFSNLAVIAGALSVGIGFGMQNIVNNFVSGLIILFERPVKRGDWISIGNTEGFVQKISVRSTLIQTFDRSDVIVPNSELISNQVTNMTLNDSFGRLIVPIGVAYGSDTDLVRTILLEIAAANPEVINDGSAPKPVVLFLAFGDNSLNFELRCHLANVDQRINVKSAINYEIDRAFRKHAISIPFPQRDLYIKEFPSGGAMTTANGSCPTDTGGDAELPPADNGVKKL